MNDKESLTVPVIKSLPPDLGVGVSTQNLKLGSWTDAKGGLHEHEAKLVTMKLDGELADAVAAELPKDEQGNSTATPADMPEAIRRAVAKMQVAEKEPPKRAAAVPPAANNVNDDALYVRYLASTMRVRFGLECALNHMTPEEWADVLAHDPEHATFEVWHAARYPGA